MMVQIAMSPKLDHIPVITIDGPSGVGKGTMGRRLAIRLGWNFLDSGSLYRALAIAAIRADISSHDSDRLAALALHLPLRMISSTEDTDPRLFLGKEDITDVIREEVIGQFASVIAALPAVRTGLLLWQRNYRQAPGLVADGRDMGTVIFPDADIKIFLDATPEERANRRCRQLRKRGVVADYNEVLTDVLARDQRDRHREVAPLKPADDAIQIDTTTLSVDAAFEVIKKIIQEKLS
jgi:cytidylate kinase